MIKLFRNPFGYFLYDARINKLSPISYDLSVALQKKDSSLLANNNEYISLCKKGYFNSTDFSLRRADSRFLPFLLSRGMDNITLQVTQDCNFRCSYCPYTENDGRNRLHSHRHMPKEVAIEAIEFLHDRSADAKMINIAFYGGEPFLRFELIEYVVSEAKKLFEGKQLTFSVTSNGSLLTRSIMSFLEENNFFLTISLDGPKSVNDANRVFRNSDASTFDVITRKLEIIQNEYPTLFRKTVINMVIDPSKDYLAYHSILSDSSPLKSYTFRTNLVDSSHMTTPILPSSEFISLMNYYLFIDALFSRGKVATEGYCNLPNSVVSQGFIDALDLPAITNAGYPAGLCIPGHNKTFVDIDGNLYPCEKVSEENAEMIIGNLKTGFDYDQCKKLMNLANITAAECKNCWCFRFCTSCCLFACNHTSVSREKRLSYCSIVRANASAAMQMYLASKFHNLAGG